MYFELSPPNKRVNLQGKHGNKRKSTGESLQSFSILGKPHIRAYVVGALGTRSTHHFLVFPHDEFTHFPWLSEWEILSATWEKSLCGRQERTVKSRQSGSTKALYLPTSYYYQRQIGNSTKIGAGDVVWQSGYLIHFTQSWHKSLTMHEFSFLVCKLKMISYRVVFKFYMILYTWLYNL